MFDFLPLHTGTYASTADKLKQARRFGRAPGLKTELACTHRIRGHADPMTELKAAAVPVIPKPGSGYTEVSLRFRKHQVFTSSLGDRKRYFYPRQRAGSRT
jgi:hypothetical protein